MEGFVTKQTNIRDPFATEPLPRAFYHPSKQMSLRKDDKKIILGYSDYETCSKVFSPTDKAFMKGTHVLRKQEDNTEVNIGEGSIHFMESWSSTERQSNSSIEESQASGQSIGRQTEMLRSLSDFQSLLNRPSLKHDKLQVATKPKSETSKESVLQRYIERFRSGVPRSREERAQLVDHDKSDFWWLTSSPPTPSDASTPKDDDRHPRSRSVIGNRRVSHSKPRVISLQSLSENQLDEKTKLLQEQANKLLEDSVASFHSSDPAVSTDGLGSTTSGMLSSFEEAPRRPTFTLPFHLVGKAKSAQQPMRPEDDILFQWRLKHKMELAQVPSAMLQWPYLVQPKNPEHSSLEAFRRRTAGEKDVLPYKLAGKFTPDPRVTQNVDVAVQMDPSFNADIPSPKLIEGTNHTYCSRPAQSLEDSLCEQVQYKQYLQAEKPQSEEENNKCFQTKTSTKPTQESINPELSNDMLSHGGDSNKMHQSLVLIDDKDGLHSNGTVYSHERTEKRVSGAQGTSTKRVTIISSQGDFSPSPESVNTIPPLPRMKSHPVNSAIGKSVSEHLFNKTSSIVTSSIDSWASICEQPYNSDADPLSETITDKVSTMLSTTLSAATTPIKLPATTTSTTVNAATTSTTVSTKANTAATSTTLSATAETATTSTTAAGVTFEVSSSDSKGQHRMDESIDNECDSDDEFPDDYILKMLRQQRAEYEIKLRQIDDLLQQSSFGVYG